MEINSSLFSFSVKCLHWQMHNCLQNVLKIWGKETIQNWFTELIYVIGQKKPVMPIQCHFCNKSWAPFQPSFWDDLCADPGTLQLPEKGKKGAFLMMEAMGTGAARLRWDNFCTSSTQPLSVLEFLLRHTSKSSCKACGLKPDTLQRRFSRLRTIKGVPNVWWIESMIL